MNTHMWKGIALVVGRERLSGMENALLNCMREIYGRDKVKIFTSLKRVEDSLVGGMPVPEYVVGVFDGENPDLIDNLFDLPGLSDEVTKVLVVSDQLRIQDIERERFPNDDMIRFSESRQGNQLEVRLRQVFGPPFMMTNVAQEQPPQNSSTVH